eukprot:1159761-Pelagomonas_calceolata.AAC.5
MWLGRMWTREEEYGWQQRRFSHPVPCIIIIIIIIISSSSSSSSSSIVISHTQTYTRTHTRTHTHTHTHTLACTTAGTQQRAVSGSHLRTCAAVGACPQRGLPLTPLGMGHSPWAGKAYHAGPEASALWKRG